VKIVLKDEELILEFEPRGSSLAAVRALPSRKYDPVWGRWHVPHTQENWRRMQLAPDIFPLDDIPAPRGTGYSIDAERGLLRIKTPWSATNAEMLRRLPDYRMWDAKHQAWFAKPTRRNLEWLRVKFPQAVWNAGAEVWYQEYVVGAAQQVAAFKEQKAAVQAGAPIVEDYKHGGPAPWDHQKRWFYLSRDRKAYALFWEQRCGKTKTLIDTACWNYVRGKIRQVLVVAPNSVKTLWVTDELPTHMPNYIQWIAASWSPSANRAGREQIDAVLEASHHFRWLVMNVEAFSSEKGTEVASRFVKSAPTMMIVDESTRIKTPGAKRTRSIIAIGKHAVLRRIATGTPATQGPLDTFSQGRFLDPEILGFGSFYAFRNHFAIMGGWNHKEVVGYSHLDELQALWDAHSSRVTRDDCFDIPPKGYQKLIVDMTPAQEKIYAGMRDRMRAELGDGRRITATIVLTQMLRLAQIAGGFVPQDPDADAMADRAIPGWERTAVEATEGGNPKIAALLELAADTQGKMVVWARFRAEVAAAADALRREYGPESVVEFHGGVDDDGRIAARTSFQDPDSPVRFLVGQTETGGLGINLDKARTLVYLSNSWSLESRLQSEDRASSASQQHSVAVVDIIARSTVDEVVVQALRDKKDIARQVTGDQWRQWI